LAKFLGHLGTFSDVLVPSFAKTEYRSIRQSYQKMYRKVQFSPGDATSNPGQLNTSAKLVISGDLTSRSVL
jgi:hypothetical protein